METSVQIGGDKRYHRPAPAATAKKAESVAHQGQIVGLNAGAVAKHHHQDGEPDARFGRREGHHEEGNHLAVGRPVVTGESDEGKVHRIEHELDRHENHHYVSAGENADDSDREQRRTQQQIMKSGNHTFTLPLVSFA